jgi:hypothetical protein
MLVPAFPLLAADFAAAPADVQLVLTLFLTGSRPASWFTARSPIASGGARC